MKKALVCVPQAGVPGFRGTAAEAEAAKVLKAHGYEVVTAHFTPFWLSQQEEAARIKNRSLYFLGSTIRIMSTVDAVYFSADWALHRTPRFLHKAAKIFGLEIIQEEEEE